MDIGNSNNYNNVFIVFIFSITYCKTGFQEITTEIDSQKENKFDYLKYSLRLILWYMLLLNLCFSITYFLYRVIFKGINQQKYFYEIIMYQRTAIFSGITLSFISIIYLLKHKE